jgi:hypothetical protein|nr:MAG TPA: Protein of unknown function (DUF1642) [Caudoviricetes sp.]
MNVKELIEKYTNYNLGGTSRKALLIRFLRDLDQLDEPEQVTIPQFVADWIEECKNDDFHLFGAMEAISLNQKKLDYWFREDDNMELFARAWLDGYEIEKERRYTVVMKGISSLFRHLKYNLLTEKWYMGNDAEDKNVKNTHTRKEIEDAGFGEVFNSPLFEVVEVEE